MFETHAAKISFPCICVLLLDGRVRTPKGGKGKRGERPGYVDGRLHTLLMLSICLLNDWGRLNNFQMADFIRMHLGQIFMPSTPQEKTVVDKGGVYDPDLGLYLGGLRIDVFLEKATAGSRPNLDEILQDFSSLI